MFSPIKIILIVPILFLILLLITQLRNKTFSRMIMILIGMIGIIFIIYPDSTTTIANRLHVGRGTDLLLYFSVISGVIGMLLLYSKLRRIEAMQTEIIRSHALESASKPAVQ